MDLNLTTTTTVINNNQLLLNAIKNKFAAQTATEAAAFSLPKFNIPVLKVPGSFARTTEISTEKKESEQNPEGNPSTQLNEFLLTQLQEKHKANDLNKSQSGFALPNLSLGTKLANDNQQTPVKFELPTLKRSNTAISSLNTALNKLQVEEKSKETIIPARSKTSCTVHPVIDLTSALASKFQNHQQSTKPTRDLTKPSTSLPNSDLDFEIPFIDCDRIDISRKCTISLPTSNEYCVTDISQLRLKHSLVQPSAIGRILDSHDNKYTAPLPLKCFSAEFQQQSVKHTLEPFRFDTKSPDDLVLEALHKYQRRYHN